MSYEQAGTALREEYSWSESTTFGATSVTRQIIGPKGAVGFVRDIGIDITTSMVGTTTVPEIQVGISSGDSTYGRYRLGTGTGTGFNTGYHRASQEGSITGNPPRLGSLFTNNVVLDGGPLSTAGIAGGTYLTVTPLGRIPANFTITNVVSGASSHCRCFLKEPIPPQLLAGQCILVQDVGGATGANGSGTISVINTANNWIEIASSTFGGTYTSGGTMAIVVVVTLLTGTGGTPTGGGFPRVIIDWLGHNVQ